MMTDKDSRYAKYIELMHTNVRYYKGNFTVTMDRNTMSQWRFDLWLRNTPLFDENLLNWQESLPLNSSQRGTCLDKQFYYIRD